jgi:hypothetical protein
VLDLFRLYAIPLAAAGILGVAVGFAVGRRSGLAAAWSLAAAFVFLAGAIALSDMLLAGARVALWAESGLLVATAYAAGFSAGAGARALLNRSRADEVRPGRAGASPPPGSRSA